MITKVETNAMVWKLLSSMDYLLGAFLLFSEIKHKSVRNQFRGSEVISLLKLMTMAILVSVWLLRKCWWKDVVIFCVLVPPLKTQSNVLFQFF